MLSKLIIFFLILTDAVLGIWLLIHDKNIAVLNPQGWVAAEELKVMYLAVILMFILAIPLFIFTAYVSWKYREGNTKAPYHPEWQHVPLQIFWWTLPFLMVCFLAYATWVETHRLEPQKSIASTIAPMRIQVVALRWKWLFIYPQEKIATVNYVVFPEKTPIEFDLTADESTMNSFWIPNLGGQLYAMTGMVNRLNLIADSTGEYRGSNAEISGKGFAKMIFKARSLSQKDFEVWVAQVKQSPKILSKEEYQHLLRPTEHEPPIFYSSTEERLFSTIVNKYMAPPHHSVQGDAGSGHEMEQMKMEH